MLVIYPLFLLISFFFTDENTKTFWKIDQTSSVEINGETNVNKFKCFTIEQNPKSFIEISRENNSPNTLINGVVLLNANGFNCENRLINKDLAETLKADKFPQIKVEFINLSTNFENKNQSICYGKTKITIGEITKEHPFTCEIFNNENKKKILSGSKKIMLSDYQLNPPTKFFGTVKVKDTLKLNFNLILEKSMD